jgi:hypothetical protein
MIVPIFMIAGGDPVLPIHIALSMLVVFTGMTAYLLYRIARRYVGFAAALTVTLIWGLSPIVTKQAANGLETAIASFMIAAAVLYYLARVRGEDDPPVSRFLVLGLLLGLGIVSRIDGTFLAMVVVLDYLFVLKRRGTTSRILLRLALVPAGVLFLYGPWVIFNVVESGSIIQDSGRATRFLSLAYAAYFGYGPESLAFKGPDISFIWTHLEHAVSSLKVIPPVQIFFRSAERLDTMLGTGAALKVIGNIAGFILLILGGRALYGWRRDGKRSERGEVHFLLAYSGLLILSYSFYIFGAFFFLRYFYPIYMIACIYLAFFLQDGFDWLRDRSVTVRRTAVAAAAVYLLFFSLFSCSQAFRSHPVYPYYDLALWVEENTGKEEKLGIFQTGNIRDYLIDEGIDIVIDHSKVIELFLGISQESMKASCTRIAIGSMYPSCGWYAVRRAILGTEAVAGEISDPDSTASARPLLENE